jgi:hypothetical protein
MGLQYNLTVGSRPCNYPWQRGGRCRGQGRHYSRRPGTWCHQFGLQDCPPSVYLGHLATGLGPHPGKQAARCETGCTPMEVFSLRPLWRCGGDSPEGWPHPSHTQKSSVRETTPKFALCNLQLRVRHIFLDCPKYTVRRQSVSCTISDMLGNDPDILTRILAILRDVNLFCLL